LQRDKRNEILPTTLPTAANQIKWVQKKATELGLVITPPSATPVN